MHSVLSRLLSAVLASFALAMHCEVTAATAQGNFVVTVKLDGICISTSLSQQTNALVKVTCQGGQFVSIEPREGRQFLGVHGGAYRFTFSRAASIPASFLGGGTAVDDWIGQGTITALRVLNLTESDERLELLVSF